MAAMFPMSSVAFTHTEEDFDSDSGDFDTEEVDEEVDELVSSGPEETNIPAVKRPKKPPKKIAQPGRVVVPIDRIQSVIEADGGLAGFALSKEALFVLSAATEAFIKRLSQVAQQTTQTQGRYTVNYQDMASATEQYQEFMFLQDTIPMPLSITEALERRELKEQELIDEDPALTASGTLQLAAAAPMVESTIKYTPPPVPSTSRAASKSNEHNGRSSKPNGKASSSKKSAKGKEVHTNGTASASSEHLEGEFLATHPYGQIPPESAPLPLSLRPQISLDAIASRHEEPEEMDVDPVTRQELDSNSRNLSTGSNSSRASSHVSSASYHAPVESFSRGRSASSGIADASIASNGASPFAPLLHDPERPGRTIYSQKQQ